VQQSGEPRSARTRADVAQVCAVEALGQLDDGLVVDVARLGELGRVDLQDLHASLCLFENVWLKKGEKSE
jgi:hypothetical protein